MTPDQTTTVLRMFRANWAYFDISDDVIGLWVAECRDVTGETGIAAAKFIVEGDSQPPPFSRFREVCQNIDRTRVLEPAVNPTEDCDRCDYGFVPGLPVEQRYRRPDGTVNVVMVETVKPCESCRPAQFAAWRERTAKANARRQAKVSETFEANPREGLARARAALAEAAAGLRPPDADPGEEF